MGFWSIFGKGKAAPVAQGTAPSPRALEEASRPPSAAPSNDPVALLARLGEPGGPGETEAMAAFEALRPSSDMVGLEEAFKFAQEEWRPGQK